MSYSTSSVANTPRYDREILLRTTLEEFKRHCFTDHLYKNHEVFLSTTLGKFKRRGFTDHLYKVLKDAGIRVFKRYLIDSRLSSIECLQKITASEICIPIFSPNYASSTEFLEEVAQMVKCRNAGNQLVLPLFYNVTRHQVQHQSGNYEEAFKRHSEHYGENRVRQWRNALAEIGGLKGWDLRIDADGNEEELIKKVVSNARSELEKANISSLQNRLEVMAMLQVRCNDVRIVGIYGISGIGKTTLAKIIYDLLLPHFKYSSFLRDVREMSSKEKGLEKLQNQLISDITRSKYGPLRGRLQTQLEFANVVEGVEVLRQRLRYKRVLILLDDVDEKDQINALAADVNWFAGGSRILITTRNKDALDVSQVGATHEVRPMHSDEALRLFYKHAFKSESPTSKYVDLSKNIVAAIGGLPLALEVIGSFLFVEPRIVWEETFEKLQSEHSEDVQDKLKISYEALKYEEKQKFLHVASSFIGMDKSITSCEFYREGAVQVLLQRCLIKVGLHSTLWMHDLLKDLGREIAQKESDKRQGKRSMIESSEDAMRVLHYQQGTKKIEASSKRGCIDSSCSSTMDSDLNQATSNQAMSHSLVPTRRGSDYEVFLSFRGPDTRKGFVDHLYEQLKLFNIHAFKDNEELHVGEEISENLFKAINQSKIFIPIFSKNYACSKWCLKEAAHMVKCRKTGNQLVLPIFYDVTPSQVRRLTGTYEEAFRKFCKNEETVDDWRNALAEIGGLKGWELQNDADGQDWKLVKKVVSKVRRELKKGHLTVKDSMVGVEDKVQDVGEMLQVGQSDVRIVGIYGIGGIGKTTLAKIIYNQLLENFEYSSFLKDVREMSLQFRGLEKLQSQLVWDILRSDDPQREFSSVDEGREVLSKRFRNKKVLILLDDVDTKEQINALVADVNWFANGSRILITTRDRNVLDVSQVRRAYEVKPMHFDDALFLFWMHAFKGQSPASDYADLTKDIVEKTGGLPLALEVIGSFLHRQSRSVWEDTLEKLQNGPYKDVRDKLWISYIELEDEEREIFLDIACFFIGIDKRIARYMWKDCKLYPDRGIEVLLQRSLIKVGDDNKFWMHDQLRDFGREIIRKQNINEPGKRSRLWSSEDARYVLENQEGTRKVEAIQLDNEIKSNDCCYTREQFKNLSDLRFLRLVKVKVASDIWCLLGKLRWLQWHYCPIELKETSLPLENLVTLDLSYSHITYDWRGWSSRQLAIKLKVLILEYCRNLNRTPDLSEFQSLERLSFRNCRSLHEVDPSIGKLKNLIFLSLENCSMLRELPQELSYLKALVELHIDGSGVKELSTLNGLKKLQLLSAKKCFRLDLPQEFSNLQALVELHIDETGVQELPAFDGFANLKLLSANNCMNLSHIPPSIGHLTSLSELSFDETDVCTLPVSIGALVKLRRLSLRNCRLLRELPDSIGGLSNLQVLLVNETGIRDLPCTLGKLEKLEVMDASGCKGLWGEISIDLLSLGSLKTLKLEGTNITVLPTDIQRLSYLQTFQLAHCDALQALPHLPNSLRDLSITCRPVETFPDLSDNWNLLELRLFDCYKLKGLPGLGNLGLLKILILSCCYDLLELPGLEKLKCLRELSITWCKSLEKLSDLSKLKQLKTLKVESCNSLQSLPNLSALKMLRHLSLTKCKKLRELQGLEELKSLERVDVGYSPSLYHYTEKWPGIPWASLPRFFDLQEYKVFLNFRGQDLSDDLYISPDINTFRDDGEIGGGRLEAMSQSKIFIPIFSEGYAFSIRCLEELAHIVKFDKKGNQSILPIFYNVTPHQVQEQSRSYGEAFKKHMNRYDAKIVEVWRTALREVGALKGWELQELQHVNDEEKKALVKNVLYNLPAKPASFIPNERIAELGGEAPKAFLDIACFLIGTDWRIASHIYLPGVCQRLRSLSLAEIIDNNKLWMRDQLRDIGREIVRQESDNEPGKRSRLWHSEEAIEVLNNKQGTERIEAICIDYGTRSEDCCLRGEQFRLLPNLRFLQLNKASIVDDFNSLLSNLKWLRWHRCPNELLATNLHLEKLVILELSETDITDDWNGWHFVQTSINLEVLILKSCKRLSRTPDISSFPKLQRLTLDDCTSLSHVDPSIGSLKFLSFLSMKNCSRLEVLPRELSSLERLFELYLEGTCVKEIPAFKNLRRLSAKRCDSLLQNLDSIGNFSSLEELVLEDSGVCRLPDSFTALDSLERLSLNGCKSLRKLPNFVGRLEWCLKELDLSHTSIHGLPECIGELRELKVLNTSGSSIKYLPSTLGLLENLEVINVSNCRNLTGEIVLHPVRLFSLKAFIFDGTNITLPPSISVFLHFQSLYRASFYEP